MKIYYQNGKGEKLSLTNYPYLMLTDTDLFDYSWANTTKGTTFPRISAFKRSMVEKKISIRVKGSTDEEYLRNIQRLTEFFDADIFNLTMGRLYVGEYYIDCYIHSSTKKSKYLLVNATTVEFNLISPDGNWKNSHLYSFGDTQKDDEIETAGAVLDYPYDYTYDLGASLDFSTLKQRSYAPSHFKLTIYGPCANPLIRIGDWNYGVLSTAINSDEKIIIDSIHKKIWKENISGEKENLFSQRLQDFYAFEKIAPGTQLVGWIGTFKFDIELYEDRSEPLWI